MPVPLASAFGGRGIRGILTSHIFSSSSKYTCSQSISLGISLLIICVLWRSELFHIPLGNVQARNTWGRTIRHVARKYNLTFSFCWHLKAFMELCLILSKSICCSSWLLWQLTVSHDLHFSAHFDYFSAVKVLGCITGVSLQLRHWSSANAYLGEVGMTDSNCVLKSWIEEQGSVEPVLVFASAKKEPFRHCRSWRRGCPWWFLANIFTYRSVSQQGVGEWRTRLKIKTDSGLEQ